MTTRPAIAETSDSALSVAPAPVAAKLPIERHCPECGEPFDVPARGPGQHKRFCGSSCRLVWANREKGQGAVLVTIAKAWRKTRGSGQLGKDAFAEMTKILDLLNERDIREGRGARVVPYVAGLLASGPYLDRMDETRLGRR